jgi:hypothetical protein
LDVLGLVLVEVVPVPLVLLEVELVVVELVPAVDPTLSGGGVRFGIMPADAFIRLTVWLSATVIGV